ncbi:hypothetical protein F511_05125 [Dorcoceras hygrometricum]|uniref:Uncharacterized protein n=1 Tax=Dorcoceras hygrometricum TaxID=472368 RepID=A0A2Z7C8A3_9LAMI|nr:hypothetical protein F511_05125 [Dorcoceras hygrometricum]
MKEERSCLGCHSWCYFVPKTLNHRNADAGSNQIPTSSAMAMIFSSLLNRRWRRYLLLILCFPFLLPLLCALCPLFCMVEMCFLITRRRQKAAAEVGSRSRLCVVDGGEVGLLQRYLEDQILLVLGSGYRCVDDDGN